MGMAGLPKGGFGRFACHRTSSPPTVLAPASGTRGEVPMIRGLYSAAAGMLSAQLGEGVVANNLANTNTPGFKAETASFASFAPLALNAVQPTALVAGGVAVTPIGTVASGAIVDATGISWSSGPLAQSSNPLAAAISGPGFFGVSVGGGTSYTRAGDFHLNRAGTLVTAAGAAVLGVNGQPISVPAGTPGATVALDGSGQVLAGGRAVGQLAVYQPAQNSLLPAGQGVYTLAAGAAAPTAAPATVQPGFLEGSNVNVVQQMAGLMQIQQAFASDQRAASTADQTAGVAISQVGTVA